MEGLQYLKMRSRISLKSHPMPAVVYSMSLFHLSVADPAAVVVLDFQNAYCQMTQDCETATLSSMLKFDSEFMFENFGM